jgi:L-ascorbate metabolism protein UlaG (beta-lactamase superfamily)
VIFGKKRASPPPPAFAGERNERFWFRRAIGFTIKATIDEPSHARLVVKRHGGDREVSLDRADLRRLMALDVFSEWPADEAWLLRMEADDLVYYARTVSDRRTTGAPLLTGPQSDAKIGLRDGLGITLAIADEEEVVPWVFMPRRGALDEKRLIGVRISSLEAGTEVYSLDLYGAPPAAAVLRWLLPMLDGTRSWPEIESRFDQADRLHARRILEWLDDCACLDASSAAKIRVDAPFVCWLGHAAALVRVGAVTLLVDPLFMRRSDPPRAFVDAPWDWRALPKIDACLVTHADNDHLNPPTLMRLSPELAMVVPSEAPRRPYQVDIGEVLRFLRFEDVRPLAPWESLSVGDTQVTAVPFEGEDWGLDLSKSTYLIEGPKGRVYLSADSYNSAEIYHRVRQRGPVDFAFLGISGCEEPLVAPPGFGYGEFYALWLPRARRNEWTAHTQGPKAAAQAAVALGAKAVFGYAAGGGSFMEMSHSDRGTHDDLAAELSALGVTMAAKKLQLGVPYCL